MYFIVLKLLVDQDLNAMSTYFLKMVKWSWSKIHFTFRKCFSIIHNGLVNESLWISLTCFATFIISRPNLHLCGRAMSDDPLCFMTLQHAVKGRYLIVNIIKVTVHGPIKKTCGRRVCHRNFSFPNNWISSRYLTWSQAIPIFLFRWTTQGLLPMTSEWGEFFIQNQTIFPSSMNASDVRLDLSDRSSRCPCVRQWRPMWPDWGRFLTTLMLFAWTWRAILSLWRKSWSSWRRTTRWWGTLVKDDLCSGPLHLA